MVWRRVMLDVRVLAAFRSLCLACAGVDTALVVCSALRSSDEHWRCAAGGKLLLGSANRDSAGRPVSYVTTVRPGESTYMDLDTTTRKW